MAKQTGSGMSDFLVNVGIESHTRIIQDRQHYKDAYESLRVAAQRGDAQWAEEVEIYKTKYQALRRAVLMLLDRPAGSDVTDDELVMVLSAALDGARDMATAATARRNGETFTAVAGAKYRVEARLGTPMTYTAPSGKQTPVGEVTISDGETPAWSPPVGEPFRLEQQYELGADGEPPAPDHVYDVMTYASITAREQQDGPPTQSMEPVEQPPDVGPGWEIGRVFVRSGQHEGFPSPTPPQLITRSGQIWQFAGAGDTVAAVGELSRKELMTAAEYWCEDLHKEHCYAELLHMHGTLWEVVPAAAEQTAGEVEHEGADQPPVKPNLHVATLYTSEQDGGSRWYELSDGWVVCARTLQEAMKCYPSGAVRIEPLREAKPDLRNAGIATQEGTDQ